MPRSCSICSNKSKAAINAAIRQGGSKTAVAERFGIGAEAVQRHRTNCLGLRLREKIAKTAAREEEQPKPIDRERFDSSDPKSLVATTARLVDEALDLLENAKTAGDRRTALAALREARDGLQLLMRANGMLSSDNAITVNLDNRRQTAQLFGKLTEQELRALAAGRPIGSSEALPAAEIIDAKAQPL